VYVDANGRRVADRRTLARIRALAIPPAWTDVWICRDHRGHVQATGRDARGRKQYRYHAEWRMLRDSAKYENVVPFGHALRRLRARVARDLRRPKLDRRKVTAVAVRVLDETAIRVGNDEYARANRSFGLTTLRDRHATIDGGVVELDFVGKGGQRRHLTVRDRQLARWISRCRDIPGQRLFQYWDESGKRRALGSGDVNRYLLEATGHPFTAKEFRTWHACVTSALLLAASAAPRSASAGQRAVNHALDRVASGLGNTRAVARRCYVHPAIVDAFLERRLHDELEREFERNRPCRGLRAEESAVLEFLAAAAR
jgi:DNA topoisomerase-1